MQKKQKNNQSDQSVTIVTPELLLDMARTIEEENGFLLEKWHLVAEIQISSGGSCTYSSAPKKGMDGFAAYWPRRACLINLCDP